MKKCKKVPLFSRDFFIFLQKTYTKRCKFCLSFGFEFRYGMAKHSDFIVRQNEAEANRIVARVLRMTLCIFSLVLILNLCRVFIIDQKVMLSAFGLSALLLLAPTVINRFVDNANPNLKYLYVILSSLFLLVIETTLSFHAVVYAFPIALACLYFSRKLTLHIWFLTVGVSIVGQFAGFYMGCVPDQNFLVFKRLVLFSILPRTLCIFSIGSLIYFISARTTKLVDRQIADTARIKELNTDMVMGFANLVENRDENTGGHVKRTSRYVELLVKELHRRGVYKDIINHDFIHDLVNAAPMHDIGKIAIPDHILQKPGKLTDEEYAIMKTHAEQGGRIIRQTFSHIGNARYRQVVYDVAQFHHEKWNGRGYPEGRKGQDIPLAARIMAVADVFDAVSQKRCYRDAIPLDECFSIIEKGRGTDFEPILVDVFLGMKDPIRQTMDEIA